MVRPEARHYRPLSRHSGLPGPSLNPQNLLELRCPAAESTHRTDPALMAVTVCCVRSWEGIAAAASRIAAFRGRRAASDPTITVLRAGGDRLESAIEVISGSRRASRSSIAITAAAFVCLGQRVELFEHGAIGSNRRSRRSLRRFEHIEARWRSPQRRSRWLGRRVESRERPVIPSPHDRGDLCVASITTKLDRDHAGSDRVASSRRWSPSVSLRSTASDDQSARRIAPSARSDARSTPRTARGSWSGPSRASSSARSASIAAQQARRAGESGPIVARGAAKAVRGHAIDAKIG